MTTEMWTEKAAKLLVGKTVRSVRYMSVEEADNLGWESQPLIIEFSDGSYIFPQADDEGNDAGALSYGSYRSSKDEDLFPVMRE